MRGVSYIAQRLLNSRLLMHARHPSPWTLPIVSRLLADKKFPHTAQLLTHSKFLPHPRLPMDSEFPWIRVSPTSSVCQHSMLPKTRGFSHLKDFSRTQAPPTSEACRGLRLLPPSRFLPPELPPTFDAHPIFEATPAFDNDQGANHPPRGIEWVLSGRCDIFRHTSHARELSPPPGRSIVELP
jgi:hypothetical protein